MRVATQLVPASPGANTSGRAWSPRGRLYGKKEETWVYYRKGGEVIGLVDFKDGKRNGKTIAYIDGQISSIVRFKDDLEDGIYEEYYEGLKIEEMNWRYDTYPNEIKFIFFVLNRKSLKLVYTFEGREMDFQCRSSTPKEIERTLNQKIDELRARMKKNKL